MLSRQQSNHDANDGDNEQECVEIKLESRQEEILRQLGIVHLDSKFARPRYSDDETDAMILKQAGVRLFNMDEREIRESGAHFLDQKRENASEEKCPIKPLSVKEA